MLLGAQSGGVDSHGKKNKGERFWEVLKITGARGKYC